MRNVFALLLVLATTGFSATAQEAVFLVRHAEKELSGIDPALTTEGRHRAGKWARMLANAGVDTIITSDALRSRETGGIIADALGLQPHALPSNDIAGLIDALAFDHDEDIVLVVAHAETIPRILESLGVPLDIVIDQGEFANLFVVLAPASDDPQVLHLLMP